MFQIEIAKVKGLYTLLVKRKFGLQEDIVHMILQLPFLHPSAIPTAVKAMMKSASSKEIDEHTRIKLFKLFNYLKSTWGVDGGKGMWVIGDWCVYRRIVRTNNDIEGNHFAMRGRAGRRKMKFYALAGFIEKEIKLARGRVREVRAGKNVKKEKSRTKRKNQQLLVLWDRLDTHSITPFKFLEQMARFEISEKRKRMERKKKNLKQ